MRPVTAGNPVVELRALHTKLRYHVRQAMNAERRGVSAAEHLRAIDDIRADIALCKQKLAEWEPGGAP